MPTGKEAEEEAESHSLLCREEPRENLEKQDTVLVWEDQFLWQVGDWGRGNRGCEAGGEKALSEMLKVQTGAVEGKGGERLISYLFKKDGMHCRRFSSIPHLYPLDARSISPAVKNKYISRNCLQCKIWGTKSALVENHWSKLREPRNGIGLHLPQGEPFMQGAFTCLDERKLGRH